MHQRPPHSSLAQPAVSLGNGSTPVASARAPSRQVLTWWTVSRSYWRKRSAPGSVSESPTAGTRCPSGPSATRILEAMSPSTGSASTGRASRGSRWPKVGLSSFATRSPLSAPDKRFAGHLNGTAAAGRCAGCDHRSLRRQW